MGAQFQLSPCSSSLFLGIVSSLKGIWVVSSCLREASSFPVDIGSEDCRMTQKNGLSEGKSRISEHNQAQICGTCYGLKSSLDSTLGLRGAPLLSGVSL